MKELSSMKKHPKTKLKGDMHMGKKKTGKEGAMKRLDK